MRQTFVGSTFCCVLTAFSTRATTLPLSRCVLEACASSEYILLLHHRVAGTTTLAFTYVSNCTPRRSCCRIRDCTICTACFIISLASSLASKSFPFSHSRLPIPSDLVQKKHISQFLYFAPTLFSYSPRRVLINQARKSRRIRKIGKTCTEKDARALALGFIVAAWFSMRGYQQVCFFRGTYRVSP